MRWLLAVAFSSLGCSAEEPRGPMPAPIPRAEPPADIASTEPPLPPPLDLAAFAPVVDPVSFTFAC